MWEHNYATCENPICNACEHYAIGYTRGKEKAVFEMREALRKMEDHRRGILVQFPGSQN